MKKPASAPLLTSALAALTTLAALAAAPAARAQQGVSDKEILVGTIQDLSGPVANYGKTARDGMQMRVDEVNAAGGVHGRQIKLLVEDNGYEPRRAVMATQKLVNQNGVFVMAGNIGTAHNMASFPVQFGKGIINFYPLTGAREMFEEPNRRLKYSFSPPYYDQVRIMLPKLVQEKSASKICIIYQDDEFGLEVLRGAEAGLKSIKLQLLEKTSYKRAATDFSSQVARLKAASCDLVVMGTLIRETVGVMGEARKGGFNPVFMGTSGSYADSIHKLGGEVVDGFYTTMTLTYPYMDAEEAPIREWAAKYKARFNEEPGVFSAYGYMIADHLIQGFEKAGKNLTTDTLIAAINSIRFEPNLFGSPAYQYSDTNRLGSMAVRLSQIQGGGKYWKVVSDYYFE